MNNKGYTLVEMIIVIGIVSILATTAIIAINPTKLFGQAYDHNRSTDLTTIITALMKCAEEHRNSFTSCGIPSSGLDNNYHAIASTDINLCPLISSGYLVEMPTDPRPTRVSVIPTGSTKITSTMCTAGTAYNTGYQINLNVVAPATIARRISLRAPNTQISPSGTVMSTTLPYTDSSIQPNLIVITR